MFIEIAVGENKAQLRLFFFLVNLLAISFPQ